MLTSRLGLWGVGVAAFAGLALAEERAAELGVVSTTPAARSLQADFETTISIHFDRAVERRYFLVRGNVIMLRSPMRWSKGWNPHFQI